MSEKFTRKIERAIGTALGADEIAHSINSAVDRRVDERVQVEVARKTGGVLSRSGPEAPTNPQFDPSHKHSPGSYKPDAAGNPQPPPLDPELTEASGHLSSGDPGFPK
jgi:hypothetical protein